MQESMMAMGWLAILLAVNTFVAGVGVGLWWSERTMKQSVTSAVEKAMDAASKAIALKP